MKFPLFLSLALFAGNSFALSITNGDFSQGLAGWENVSVGGSASVGPDQALYLDGGIGAEPYSASLWQGDDGSFLFSNPLSLATGESFLSFDLMLASQDLDSSESGSSIFEDSLSIELYDADDWSFDLYFQSGWDFDVTDSWQTVFLDISSLQGRDFALTINLFDEDDGVNSSFALDNFFFTNSNQPDDPVSVSEPASLSLFLIALTGFALRRRSVRNAALTN
ncbi:PEP-CTERM sorting domain-containing protein [Marinobacter salinisoli]|uniref:PEP-CTERM sorting domain-containing protein n=1 Tax=Marinobacter salinisoli TaxID=2769486 RepID=A0ABX7MZB3_9GAMM|nr:PEP-CTERM sorting domain-containing protein [Marinobacter salinisoli]QSP95538.1 PEP-CTERM sorting domain-containing protein [Marinobacter salinisoli]